MLSLCDGWVSLLLRSHHSSASSTPRNWLLEDRAGTVHTYRSTHPVWNKPVSFSTQSSLWNCLMVLVLAQNIISVSLYYNHQLGKILHWPDVTWNMDSLKCRLKALKNDLAEKRSHLYYWFLLFWYCFTSKLKKSSLFQRLRYWFLCVYCQVWQILNSCDDICSYDTGAELCEPPEECNSLISGIETD